MTVTNLTPAPAAIQWQSSSAAVEVIPADAVIPPHQQEAFQVAVWGAAVGQQQAQLQCHLEHGAVQEVAVLATVQGEQLSLPWHKCSQPASTSQGALSWRTLSSGPLATVCLLACAPHAVHWMPLGFKHSLGLSGWSLPVHLSASCQPQAQGLL